MPDDVHERFRRRGISVGLRDRPTTEDDKVVALRFFSQQSRRIPLSDDDVTFDLGFVGLPGRGGKGVFDPFAALADNFFVTGRLELHSP
jgi:hypothetical protein